MASNMNQETGDCIKKWSTFFQNYATQQTFSVRDVLWSGKISFDSCPDVPFVHISLSPFTSMLMSSIIKSVRVTHKIFWSCFLCAVVQLTHFLGNDVIKALASDVIVADPYTVNCRCSPVCCHHFLKDVLF